MARKNHKEQKFPDHLRWRCLSVGCNPMLDEDLAQAHRLLSGHRVAKWPVRSAAGKAKARERNKGAYYDKYNVGDKSAAARGISETGEFTGGRAGVKALRRGERLDGLPLGTPTQPKPRISKEDVARRQREIRARIRRQQEDSFYHMLMSKSGFDSEGNYEPSGYDIRNGLWEDDMYPEEIDADEWSALRDWQGEGT